MKKFILLFTVLTALMLAGAGCTKKIYVPVERTVVSRDSAMRVIRTADTLLLRDSIVIRERGDTVERNVWRDRLHIVRQTDTVYKEHRDTVLKTQTLPPDPPAKATPASRLPSLLLLAFLSLLFLLLYYRRKRSK